MNMTPEQESTELWACWAAVRVAMLDRYGVESFEEFQRMSTGLQFAAGLAWHAWRARAMQAMEADALVGTGTGTRRAELLALVCAMYAAGSDMGRPSYVEVAQRELTELDAALKREKVGK